MNNLIIDTDIIIDFIRNDNKTILYLDDFEKNYNLSITEITYMELLIGCRNKNEINEMKKFINRFNLI